MVSDELMHSSNALGIPPHQLNLSVGAMCACLRNIDPDAQLMNGTKLEILSIWRRVIQVRNMRT